MHIVTLLYEMFECSQTIFLDIFCINVSKKLPYQNA